MDLNSALKLSGTYRDYQDTETRDHDLNRDVVNRIFDIGPMTTQYNKSPQYTLTPMANDCQHSLCTAEKAVPMGRQSSNQMSREYLQMKHAQEYESLMENPNVNQISIERLKQDQFNETKFLADQIQLQHANKYKNLKYMSPDQLNPQLRQSWQNNVLPTTNQNNNIDVYMQTAYTQLPQNSRTRDLKKELDARQQQILRQKDNKGIQSYYQNYVGTTLQEAYNVI